MTLLEVYQRAEADGIEIDEFKMKELISASFPNGWIVLDRSRITSSIEEKEVLAHELGHCETESFYNIYSRYNTKERCERKADRRAISILVPRNEYCAAIRAGYHEYWELADYFGVSCQFMLKAMEFYLTQGIDNSVLSNK